MSTTLQKPQEVERRWYIIDAANKPVGRTAALVATLLRGKHKGTFTPNVIAATTSSLSTARMQSSPARSLIRKCTIATAHTLAV